MFRLKTRKSAGIRVTAAVYRLIARANQARDCRDWPQAAAAYAQALKADPSLAHIWIQLGHASKEHGQRAAASDAYRRALTLGPDAPEPHLHLGHLASLASDHAAAGRHYLAAFRADPGHADAAVALHRAIGLARGSTRKQLIDIIRTTLGDPMSDPLSTPSTILNLAATPAADSHLSLTFDASDLIGYFAHGRLPTGIQRVQIQTISNALRPTATTTPPRDIHVCCLIDGRDDWLEIPAAIFLALIDLSQRSGDRTEPAWIIALQRLHLALALASPFVFPHGSCLVNLGASWQLHNHFLFVREAKAKHAIRYIPFIHDLIPVVAPQHFTRAAKLEVVPWIIGIFTHADHFLTNSQSTRRDLIATAATLGHTLDPVDVEVIPLDADSRTPTQDLPTTALARWHLEQGKFALLVSTVESRKGHITAFDAWQALIARHGGAKLPRLVCVGKTGWLSDEVYERLEKEPALAARITMLSGLTDDELALLYRTCLFTLYPSLYEGWGLPITEALCWGKPVIASDTSSLPEAGGRFAVYVEPGSVPALAAAVERMTFDAAWRDAIVTRIEAGFKPRSWTDIATQIEAELARFAARRTAALPVQVSNATLGAYHSIARGTAQRVWPGAGTGEAFRVGVGWRAPDFDVCWSRPQGGELAIGLASAPPGLPLRAGLLLVGAQGHDSAWHLQVKSSATLSGILVRGGRKWITFTHAPAPDGVPVLRLRLRAEPIEPGPMRQDDDGATIGLAGFFLYPANDVAAGMRLLEAITLGNLDDVDAYRETAPPDTEPDPWLDA